MRIGTTHKFFMSTFGIVALSVLIGIFISLLIGASGYLIYVGWSFKKIVVETRSTLIEHRKEWAGALKSLGDTLAQHRTLTEAQIGRINGQQIGEAVERFSHLVTNFVAVAKRSEAAALAIIQCTKQWLSQDADEDDNDNGANSVPASRLPTGPIPGTDPLTGYATAAPGEHFVSRSRVALDDSTVLAEESANNTQT